MEFNVILASLVVSFFVIPLTAYVNIKVKFAPDEYTAIRHLIKVFLMIIILIVSAFLIYTLYQQITSDEPITRKDVFAIIISTLGLFNFFLSYLIHVIFKLIKGILSVQSDHIVTTQELLKMMTGAKLDSLDKQAENGTTTNFKL